MSASEVLATWSRQQINFRDTDCVRLAFAVFEAERGFAPTTIMNVSDWTTEQDALRAVREFGGTLTGAMVRAASELDLRSSQQSALDKADIAIGLVPMRCVFGATVAVHVDGVWWTVSGIKGLQDLTATISAVWVI